MRKCSGNEKYEGNSLFNKKGNRGVFAQSHSSRNHSDRHTIKSANYAYSIIRNIRNKFQGSVH
jgi:hypothetical protein